MKFPEKQTLLMIVKQSLEDKQDMVNAFYDAPKFKHFIRPRIIVRIMKLMRTGINLTQIQQIIIVN